jgi:RNA polymerase sigma-70 factor (ECF subfamily)
MFSPDELNRLYRYCLSLTRHSDDAYDLLQSAIEKFLHRDPPTPDKRLAYLRQIIRYHFIDDYRHRQLVQMESLEEVNLLDVGTQTLDQMMMDQQTLEQVWQQLTPEASELLYLWAVEGQTAQQIADELAQPRGTILSRIHRIRKKLLEAMGTAKPSEGQQS